MTEQQVLDKYFFIKTDNVQQSQLMIPKLRTVTRKLTNKKFKVNNCSCRGKESKQQTIMLIILRGPIKITQRD